MKKCCVYFNDKSGYYVVPEIRAKDVPVWVSAGKIEQVDIDSDITVIGEAIHKALNTSDTLEAPELSIARNNHYWNDYGYKSYAAFSKNHSAVKVEDNGSKIQLTKLIRDKKGAYERSQIENDNVELDVCVESKVIAVAINKILGNDNIMQEVVERSFMTLGKARVTYDFLNWDLEDCGDGGTDAYQIYRDLDSNNYIAFLIDNGYQSYDESAIRNVLERQFGIFDSFNYDSASNKICIKATNDKCLIESSLFYNDDDSLELLCYTEHSDSKVVDIYHKIRDSIQIKWN